MDQEPRDKDKLMLENNKGSGGGLYIPLHTDTGTQKYKKKET